MLSRDIQRTIMENAIRLQLRGYESSGKRSLRRLVDTARHLTKSKVQKELFDQVGTIFEDENSLYYDALDRLMKTVDRDTIIHFGVNLGYEAMSKGAGKIRRLKKQTGEDTSWLIEMHIGEGNAAKYKADAFRKTVRYFTQAGANVFSLFLSGPVDSILNELSPAIREQDTASFLLFLPNVILSQETMQTLSAMQNVLLLIPGNHILSGKNQKTEPDTVADSHTETASAAGAMAEWLSEKRMLFGYYLVTRREAVKDLNDYLEPFDSAPSPIIFLLQDMDQAEFPEEDPVLTAFRENPELPLLPVNYRLDTAAVNKMISGKVLSVRAADNIRRSKPSE